MSAQPTVGYSKGGEEHERRGVLPYEVRYRGWGLTGGRSGEDVELLPR